MSLSLADLVRLQDNFNLFPMWEEIPCDMDTPISLYLKLCKGEDYSFLLESLEGGEKWGRYSIIGYGKFITYRNKGNEVHLVMDDKESIYQVTDPLGELKRILKEFSVFIPDGMPRFFGGAVGFISYDMVRYFEKLPNKKSEVTGFSDTHFIIPRNLVIFDNFKHNLKLITFFKRNETFKDITEAHDQAKSELNKLKERIFSQLNPQKESFKKTVNLVPYISKSQFEEMVIRAKEYVHAGDIIQVVLSQRFHARNDEDTFSIYRALRRINPSPYLYYIRFNDEILIGSSPEILVRLNDGVVELRPIAGTRRRGTTQEEDIQLEKELLSDIKERAEHIMLVDLGRNDIGRVSVPGTVEVYDFMTIERYSHVMHIVSGVRGRLREGLDMFDVLRACFPAGTVTGAPKIRAMEIIEELEPFKRGPYAGCVGYFGFNGNMDMAITIRTLFQKGNDLYLQTGAGIVADSVPEKEWEETINKAQALMQALR